MNDYYDVHSWSKQNRQEALHEVRTKQLEWQLRENRKERSERDPVSFAWASVLSLVRGA